MKYFKPNMYRSSIHTINYDKLKDMGIKCLIFDLDNTLGLIDEVNPPTKTKELIKELKKDFIVIISSNNVKKRINKYLKKLDVDGVSFSLKPSIYGLKKIKYKYNLKKKEMIMIGDQLITDVLSAKRFRIKSILVDPLGEKDLKITGLNRKLEDIIINRLHKKGQFTKGKYYE